MGPQLGPTTLWSSHPAHRGLHIVPDLGHDTSGLYAPISSYFPAYLGSPHYQYLHPSTIPLSSSPQKKSRMSEMLERATSPATTLPEVHKLQRCPSPRPALSRRQILASLEEDRLTVSSAPSKASFSSFSSFSSSSDGSDSVFSRSVLLQSIEKEPEKSRPLTEAVRFTLDSTGEDTEEEEQEEESQHEEENSWEDDGEKSHEEDNIFTLDNERADCHWEDQVVPGSQVEENWEKEEDQVVPSCQQSSSPVQFCPQSVELEELTWVATLGVGGFGRVELVTGGPDNQPFALKKLKKIEIQDVKQQQHILNEKAVMLKCQSPFIVRLYRTFRCTKYLYMLMEPCLGGELWTLLRNSRRFSDYTAGFYVACVILALEYLHGQGVIYRDLKPENLLLDSSGYVKLTDFGFAKQLVGEERAWTFCGTPEYVAPEIITNKSHDQRADIWSVGILVFELITGAPPFTNRKSAPGQVYQDILRGLRATPFPSYISGPASEVIRQCCRLSPLQRPSLHQLKHFVWFSNLEWSLLAERRLAPPSVPRISHSISVENFDSYSREEEPGDCHESWADSF